MKTAQITPELWVAESGDITRYGKTEQEAIEWVEAAIKAQIMYFLGE